MKWYLGSMLVFGILDCAWLAKYDLEIKRIESLNGTGVEGIYEINKMSISNINRTAFVVNVEFETFVDFDDNFSVRMFVVRYGDNTANG